MYEKQGYLNEKFRLFHLCDKSDRVYEYHYHDFYKIIFFVRGNVTYNIEGKNYELMPYDIVFVGRNEIHKPTVSPESEYERYILYISESFFSEDQRYKVCFDKTVENHVNVTRTSTQDNNTLIELLDSMYSSLNSEDTFGDLYADINLRKLLLTINDSILKNGIDYEGHIQFNSKIVEVCDYINKHLSEDLSVAVLSDRFYISKYYFMHQFKAQTGISLHQYILEKRIQYTHKLVEDGMKVTQACLEAGFNEYSTYLKASKKKLLNIEKD